MRKIKMSVVAAAVLKKEIPKATQHYLDHEQYSMLKLQKGRSNG